MSAKLLTGKKPQAGGRFQSGNLTKRQKEVLAELEKLAKRLGLKVSTGRLLFAGLKLKGGRCSLRDQPWLVLDMFLPYEDQVETFKRAFLEITPETGIPDSMVRNLSKEVRAVAALTVRAIGFSGALEAGSGSARRAGVDLAEPEGEISPKGLDETGSDEESQDSETRSLAAERLATLF